MALRFKEMGSEMELVDKLMRFGLTRQEAVIYTALHSDGELTGYEAAKITGISRSNVYTALAGLVEKGAAYVAEEAVTKYTPVSFEELSNNYIHSLSAIQCEILKELPKKRHEADGYITIRGRKNILDKLRNMLLETEYRVYMSVNIELLNIYKEELKRLIARGIKVVLITNEDPKLEGAFVYYKSKIECEIRLICDSQRVLTGQADDETDATCLYSQNKNLVDVFKEMMKNEIRLIELIK